MPQFDTTFFTGQIFWMLLSFGFVYVMMATVICPMIEKVLSARQEKINSYLDRANALNQEAESIHQCLTAYQRETEQKTTEKLRTTAAKLQTEAQKIESKSDRALRQKVHKAEQDIALANQAFTQKTNPLILDMAQTLIRKLTGGTP